MSARAVAQNHSRPLSRLRPTRWCVLISGRGSNLAALLEKPDIEIRLVVSSNLSADGLAKARRAGVPTVSFQKFDWTELDQMLREHSIDGIFLLGFMKIVPASFLEKWEGRILNLHPSLLPKYPGLKSIERAVAADDDCGATVHEVVVEVDAGKTVATRTSCSKKNLSHLLDASLSEKNRIVETLVHIDEQRLVKEIVDIWQPLR